MKLPPLSQRRSGIALVLVLAFLVLITTLIVSFFSSVTTEVSEAKSYANEATTKQLADSAVQMVMGTIQLATTSGSSFAWASQPGMIRTYDNSGNAVAYYKLYSSNHIVIEAGQTSAFNLSDDLKVSSGNQITDWANQPAIFTDLNAPVTASSGTNYPIFDPRAKGVVEGFDLSTGGDSPAVSGSNPAPMPVKWIYVLKDGSLTSPTSVDSTGNIASWNGADIVPSITNPITGRIAFWTDDETSKININTASEGTFWDTPRCEGTTERNFGKYQFAHAEYQRYPGHPATVSLSTVLKGFLPNITAEDIYGMAPRIVAGGSKQGTQVVTSGLASDSARLYATVDEFIFNQNRATQGLTQENLQQLRFFLTAHSSAPELTLFGTPRISIWPVYNNLAATAGTAYGTSFDRLSAFCSTLGGSAYYFQRQSATSTTTDITIDRNNTLLNYLDTLTSQEIPGFGGNFQSSSKYGKDETHQILTEIFDYIRATNSRDSCVTIPYADPNPSYYDSVGGRGEVAPSIHKNWDTQGFGRFYRVAQASILFTGIGRGKQITTGTSAAVDIAANQVPTTVSRVVPDDNMAVQAFFLLSFFDPSLGWTRQDPSFTVEIENLDKFKLNNTPMQFPQKGSLYVRGGYPDFWGASDCGGNMDFRVMIDFRTLQQTGDSNIRCPFYSTILPIPTTTPNITDPRMDFAGGDITVRIYFGNSTSLSDLIQTYTIKFPSNSELYIPTLSNYRHIGSQNRPYGTWTTKEVLDSGTGDRFDAIYPFGASMYIIDNSADVLQSVVLKSGDYRQLAQTTVSSELFTDHPLNKTERLAYGFCLGANVPFGGATRGILVKNALYSGSSTPVIPYGINGISDIPGVTGVGDWDTGISYKEDGPYINKPDDGCISGLTTGTTPYFAHVGFQQTSDAFSSPNRQLASPMMFGSLPTGIKSNKPWQTLFFRPEVDGHPGAKPPKDHLLADLFWMPVVEPYAISETASTSGKINMNYQIVPYSYITRNTALRAAMKAEKIAALPVSAAPKYKTDSTFSSARQDLNLDENTGTLRQFKERFAANDIFRSATEICDIWLVPANESWSTETDAVNFWKANQLTGDNLRERPYSNIYAKLTTKSNSYTVHYRVQLLKKSLGTGAAQWVENKDKVTGEFRGSSLIERYIDPNDPNLTTASTSGNYYMEPYYKLRVTNTKKFAQ